MSVAMALAAVCPELSAIVVTDAGTTYSENFNSLASSGTTSSAMPVSWWFSESGSNANATYGIGNGSSATGNTYSFGSTGSTDRALGGLRSGTLIPMFGVEVTNATGAVLNALDLTFVGEQWRLGTLGRIDRLDFQFSTDATSLGTGTWSDLDALDFVAPTTTGTVGLLDGNLAANRSALEASILGLAWADGTSLWLRWSDLDATNSDDGLAIDDFTLIARRSAAVPGQPVPDSLPVGACFGAVMLGFAAVRRCIPACERVA